VTAPLTLPGTTTTGGDDDFGHLWCCDPNEALCGADLSDTPDAADGEWDEEDVCPLCVLENDFECRRCGR